MSKNTQAIARHLAPRWYVTGTDEAGQEFTTPYVYWALALAQAFADQVESKGGQAQVLRVAGF